MTSTNPNSKDRRRRITRVQSREAKSEDLSEGESLPAPKPKGRQPKSVTSRRKNNRGDAMDQVDEEAFKEF